MEAFLFDGYSDMSFNGGKTVFMFIIVQRHVIDGINAWNYLIIEEDVL